MMVLLKIIVGLICLCWIVALFFKEFRSDVVDFSDIFGDLLQSVKEEWERSKWQALVILLLLPLAYLILIFFLLISSCLFVGGKIFRNNQDAEDETGNATKSLSLDERDEMIKWRDKYIKSFFYEGKVPFDFDSNTYFYLENWHNKELNDCIENHLDAICKIFAEYNFRFVYLPKWNPNTELISRANISDRNAFKIRSLLENNDTVEYTRILCVALQIDLAEIDGGIFHFACFIEKSKYVDDTVIQSKFTHFPMVDVNDDNIEEFCRRYCDMIVDGRKNPGGCFSLYRPRKNWTGWDFYEIHGYNPNDYADYTFPKDMKDIAENVKKEIEQLKEGGYYELLLHTLGSDTVDELRRVKLNPTLSRLVVTDDYRIVLEDFGKEVKMTPLQKTLYIFYLRHPEGIEFKLLSAYYDELLEIYKVLSNREDLKKQQESIRRLVDVTDNAINEKCSRIKEAFLKVTDDFIARNYYIVQKKEHYWEGNSHYSKLSKAILIDRNLVEYSSEFKHIEVLVPKDKMKELQERDTKLSKGHSALVSKFHDKNYPKGKLIEEYTEFLNECPQYYRAYYERAILYTHVGRYKEAIADNEILIKHNERLWSDALINKAESLYFMKEYGLALKSANRYFEVEEQTESEAYKIRAEIFKKLKMYDEHNADMRMYKKKEKEEKKKKKY